jgi:hypothetical protein
MSKVKTTLAVAVLALVLAGTALGSSFSRRTLSDAHVGTSKSELQAQISYSQNVKRFFDNHHWMVAARHRTCWSHVPWAKTCDRARRAERLHARLLTVAQAKMARLYPPRVEDIIMEVFGPSVGGFAQSVAKCESHFHTWATNGQYYGIFQMGSHERSIYGGSSSNPWEQVRAAHAYYLDAGWGPWQCA